MGEETMSSDYKTTTTKKQPHTEISFNPNLGKPGSAVWQQRLTDKKNNSDTLDVCVCAKVLRATFIADFILRFSHSFFLGGSCGGAFPRFAHVARMEIKRWFSVICASVFMVVFANFYHYFFMQTFTIWA